jgi:hypothetical protein
MYSPFEAYALCINVARVSGENGVRPLGHHLLPAALGSRAASE